MAATDDIYGRVIAGQADTEYLTKQELPLLLKLSSRIRKYRKDAPGDTPRIAVLGTYSIQHFTMMLDAFLLGMGINASIYEGEYDGIRMDVLNDDSPLYEFEPQIVLILMDHRAFRALPSCLDDEKTVERLVKEAVSSMSNIWDRLCERIPGCQIFQSNIVVPDERPLGNLEAGVPYSHTGFFRRIDEALTVSHPSAVTIVDMEHIASYAGKKTWFDHASYFLSKTGFSADALPGVCRMFARLIGAASGKLYKCLVLDLDNTLWDGVVGDDGYDGINLDPNDAVGEAYRHFQEYVLALKERGVILAVCSKNDEETAREPFEKNPDMILKSSDIACFVANWEDKASNLKKIADSLSIGTDSLVFVDDNPAERELVRKFMPEVLVIDMPEDPSYYARAVDESEAFSWIEVTKEDLDRAGTYAANAERSRLQENFVDYDEYLRALEMHAVTGEPEGSQMKRFAQLINKSNQFNLRTRRYPEEELEVLKADKDTRLIYVELSDRFSDYGIISCLILKKEDRDCFIDTWLMSCRVLKRGVEYLAFDRVYLAAKEWGCDRITGEYIPTKKNGMVKDLFTDLGFSCEGDGRYFLSLDDYRKKDIFISI